MPLSEDDLKKLSEIGYKILIKLSEHQIPSNPDNYAIWFDYFTKKNQNLVAEINTMVSKNRKFTEETNKYLFTKYVGASQEALIMEKIHNETQKMIKGIFEQIMTTTDSASGYGDKLDNYSDELKKAKDISQVQNIIGTMVKETREMAESSKQLKAKLEAATEKTRQLQEKLEESKKEAMIDSLTEINNRKAFDRKISKLYEEAKNNDTFFSVAMVDIDYFKKFNDTYGHKIGDAVLKIVARILHNSLKGSDFPARFGGEEFIFILPMTILENACIVAEQIRIRISVKRLMLDENKECPDKITASIGVAQYKPGDSIESVIERADKALYLAKKSGRNNVKSEDDLKS